jgi:hypothetical protein
MNSGERDPVPGEMDIYKQQLAGHDWWYDRADDFTVWKRGSEKMAGLLALRKRLDKSGEIWNQFAPAEFKVKPIYQSPT